jgi:nucleoside-diphosphate-sugar epimerase
MLKVLLTGATGSIGGAVLRSLLASGHQVTSLVRDQSKGELIATLGERSSFKVLPIDSGSIPQITSLAKEHDIFIHSVFQRGPEGTAVTMNLCRSMIGAGRELNAQGLKFQFVFTSGVLSTGNTPGPVDETFSGVPYPVKAWRNVLDNEILSASTPNFVTTVVRPGWVYPTSYVDLWLQAAKAGGAVKYLEGSSQNFVSLVHLADLGSLFALIIKHRSAGLFNATDGHPLTVRQIVNKAKEICGVYNEQTFSDPFAHVRTLGYFSVGQCLTQQIVTSRAIEVGWVVKHANWLEYPHQV